MQIVLLIELFYYDYYYAISLAEEQFGHPEQPCCHSSADGDLSSGFFNAVLTYYMHMFTGLFLIEK